ncbi:MAG TPA: aldehyde dehydrogenase family protein, partial [Thermoplasmata archaeon]|nr:aldehyde dehydrogenase family protein [Thermoplasmata archaeon]
EDAVRKANDTPYGLLAAVWTRDLATAHTVARRLECGMVVVNESPTTYPQTPFAGMKSSGVGFEQGLRALDTYSRRKNVLVNIGVARKKTGAP